MTLSQIDNALNAMESMIGGVQKEVGQSYENLSLSLPSSDRAEKTDASSDVSSRVNAQAVRLMSMVNHLEWLMHMIQECNSVVDPQPEATPVPFEGGTEAPL